MGSFKLHNALIVLFASFTILIRLLQVITDYLHVPRSLLPERRVSRIHECGPLDVRDTFEEGFHHEVLRHIPVTIQQERRHGDLWDSVDDGPIVAKPDEYRNISSRPWAWLGKLTEHWQQWCHHGVRR